MIGTTLGAYRIESELGSGGMGNVYAAKVVAAAPGVDLGDRVALKVVHPHLLELPGVFERYVREGEIGRAVSHPNVVRTLDADAVVLDDTAHHFLVMEFVEGQTVRELLRELGRVPEELCRHIGAEIAHGLAAIHAAGVVHRDLKLENVLITPDHQVKVMDLGVARLTDEVIRLSQSGAFVGSLQCAAPEQLSPSRGDVDRRADLHALGVLLYELACGRHPFGRGDVRQVIHAVVHVEPRPLTEIAPTLSPFLEALIHKLLEKQPDDRFQSAEAVADALVSGEQSAWWRAERSAGRASLRDPLRRMHIPRDTPLFGRDTEMARLHMLYERARAGSGQVVLLEGEAGIGKSRLVDEFVRELEHSGEDLTFLFGGYAPTGTATAAGAFSTAFREALGPEGGAPRLDDMAPLAPAFDAVLQGHTPPPGSVGLTRESLASCFARVTRAISEARPLVLLIDDLHFAPEDARSLFTALALAIPESRVLLIGTLRPGTSIEWISNVSRMDHCRHLTLSRLGPKDLARLLERCFHSEHTALELGYHVALASDGNPFFVIEIVRDLRERRVVRQATDGSWELARKVGKLEVPASLLDLVSARIAALDDEERELLDIAACCGVEFDPAILGDVVGLRPVPILRALARIERRHRLVRSTGARIAFDHQQIRDALYDALPEALRRAYHTSIADVLETRIGGADGPADDHDAASCAELCDHLLNGDEPPRAALYLVPALEHLVGGHLHTEVVALAARALRVDAVDSDRARLDVLLRQAVSCDVLGHRDEERAALDAAHAIAERLFEQEQDEVPLGRVTVALGSHLFRHSEFREAERRLRRGNAIAHAQGDLQTEGRAVSTLGSVALWRGNYQEATEFFGRALEIARAVGSNKEVSSAIGNLGSTLNRLGRPDEARAHYEESLALAEQHGFPAGQASAHCNLAIVMRRLGRYEEAKKHGRAALGLSRMLGHRRGEIADTSNLGNVLFSEGHYDDARRHHERCVKLSKEIGDRRWQGIALHNLANAWSQLGEVERARELVLESRAIAEEIGDRGGVDYGNWLLGDQAGWAKDLVNAERLLRRAVEGFRAAGSTVELAGALVSLAALLARTARAGEARARFGEAIQLAARTAFCAPALLARCRLALLDAEADPETSTVAEAETALEADGGRLERHELLEARLLLWRATSGLRHLVAAHELREDILAKNPNERHAAMLRNIPVHREVVAAWTQHGHRAG